jgi:hypothetical protein
MTGQTPVVGGAATHLQLAAFHEAGHAVVALLLGIQLNDVSIDHRFPGNGRTGYWRSPAGPVCCGAPDSAAPSRWARRLNAEQRATVFALAGPLAEARLLGLPLRSLGSIGDLEAVHQLVIHSLVGQGLAPHGAVRPGADAFFERELRRTRSLLSQPKVWLAITVLAHELLCWGRVPGSEAAATVQWAFAGCRQLGLFTGKEAAGAPAAPGRMKIHPKHSRRHAVHSGESAYADAA